MGKNHEKLVSPLLMWLIVIIGIIIFVNIIPKTRIFTLGIFGLIIFLLTLVNWLYFFINAINIHRKAAFSVSRIDKLVKSGVYSKVRHPIYSADIMLAFGIFFLYLTLNVLISVIWLTFILIIWMNLEEKSLISKFGNEYKEYKKKVPMFFPYKMSYKKL